MLDPTENDAPLPAYFIDLPMFFTAFLFKKGGNTNVWIFKYFLANIKPLWSMIASSSTI